VKPPLLPLAYYIIATDFADTKELVIIGTFAGIVIIIFGISINAFGIYVRRNPTFGWRMNEGWKVKGDSEPSDAYISSMRFSGAATLWIGSFFIIMGILTLL
jgi:uncharacterized membrane protein HdeD (DUF308 family)